MSQTGKLQVIRNNNSPPLSFALRVGSRRLPLPGAAFPLPVPLPLFSSSSTPQSPLARFLPASHVRVNHHSRLLLTRVPLASNDSAVSRLARTMR